MIEDHEQVLRRTCEPIKPGTHDLITFSNKVEHRLKLRPFPDRRNLFAENLFTAGSGEISHLRVKTGLLIQGACPRITDLQIPLLSQLTRTHCEPTVSKTQIVLVRDR